MLISIAICTFNRASSLKETLTSFAAASWPSATELLVVDNNSTDNTRDVAVSFATILPIRYVFEREQGLSAARNRAIREMRGDVLLFTDDDVRVDTAWLNAYSEAIAQYPSAAYFGGRVIPYWPHGRPKWMKDEGLALIGGLLVRFHLGESLREFAPNEPTPYGASFGIRRNWLNQVGEFRKDLGVNGSVPGRGEEAEYLDRVRAAGGNGVYVGHAIAHHYTDERRLRYTYLFKYGRQKGVAARTMGHKSKGSRLNAALYLLRGVGQLLKGRGDRARQCVINAGIQWQTASGVARER
jgi:glucosyl-dolichyl phosphate glucuronosyltransferase